MVAVPGYRKRRSLLGPRSALNRKRPVADVRTCPTRRHDAPRQLDALPDVEVRAREGVRAAHREPAAERDRPTVTGAGAYDEHGAIATLPAGSTGTNARRPSYGQPGAKPDRKAPCRSAAVRLLVDGPLVAGEIPGTRPQVVAALRESLIVENRGEALAFERRRKRAPRALATSACLDPRPRDLRRLVSRRDPDTRGIGGPLRVELQIRSVGIEAEAAERDRALRVGVAGLVLEPKREAPIARPGHLQVIERLDVAALDSALEASLRVTRCVCIGADPVSRGCDRGG